MKKTILFTALTAIGLSVIAQTDPQIQGESLIEKPAKIILLKRVVNTEIVQATSPARAALAATPAKPPSKSVLSNDSNDALLKLAAPVLKVRTQELPGLGVMPGESSDMRIKSVRVGSDRNELIYISQGQLNKISTPFDSPQIIDSTGAILKAVGQDLFLQPASDKPLTVYITNGGVGQSIGLTLVPRMNLPAQTIVLQPDSPTGSPAVKAVAEEIVAGDYVSRINGLIKSVALGKTPAGFTRSRMPASMVASAELMIEPQYKFAGSSYDIYFYKVRSLSNTPLELKEEAFYTEAVRAVAFFPTALLQAGEITSVYVIADRPSKDTAQ